MHSEMNLEESEIVLKKSLEQDWWSFKRSFINSRSLLQYLNVKFQLSDRIQLLMVFDEISFFPREEGEIFIITAEKRKENSIHVRRAFCSVMRKLSCDDEEISVNTATELECI